MNNELQKMWEKCGCSTIKKTGRIIYPDLSVHADYPEPTLDNLFKWVVPKAREWLPLREIFERWLYLMRTKYKEDPAEALKQALQEVLNDH